ncbi:hypothetical protein MKW92_052990 [Papaver armeniacum]|nr:hypothetical protein MKW92_052990 [Papaver armeniacum]
MFTRFRGMEEKLIVAVVGRAHMDGIELLWKRAEDDDEPLNCCYFYPRNTSARPLIASAIKTGDFSELADPRLEKRYVEREKDV